MFSGVTVTSLPHRRHLAWFVPSSGQVRAIIWHCRFHHNFYGLVRATSWPGSCHHLAWFVPSSGLIRAIIWSDLCYHLAWFVPSPGIVRAIILFMALFVPPSGIVRAVIWPCSYHHMAGFVPSSGPVRAIIWQAVLRGGGVILDFGSRFCVST